MFYKPEICRPLQQVIIHYRSPNYVLLNPPCILYNQQHLKFLRNDLNNHNQMHVFRATSPDLQRTSGGLRTILICSDHYGYDQFVVLKEVNDKIKRNAKPLRSFECRLCRDTPLHNGIHVDRCH